MWLYVIVFLASLLVDLLPFVGPPAWTVMVFLQMRYGLNIWLVLIFGVLGSTLGRYILSLYIPMLSAHMIKDKKSRDIQFIGEKLGKSGWKVQLFVLFYTLLPLPSTPLFTAAGMAKIRAMIILPAFLVGKFTSDMIMVLTGDYVAKNAVSISKGLLSWKSISGTAVGIVIILMFLFIDWHKLLQEKKFTMNFNIWK